jgi:D-alanine-D-alanine ligase
MRIKPCHFKRGHMNNAAQKRRIAVVMGGRGSERDVSLQTGEAVTQALEAAGHAVVKIFENEHLAHDLHAALVDLVFLALPDSLAQEGEIQGLLEVLQMPYTGCGAYAVARSADKDLVNKVLRQHNLATPTGYFVSLNDAVSLQDKHQDLGFPATVRSAHGSSIPALVNSFDELTATVANVCAARSDALVERAVTARQVTVAVVNGRVLGPCEISRTAQGGVRHHVPPRISATRAANLEIMALRAYDALHCWGPARVDFLVPDDGNEVIVDVNVNPGLMPCSLVAKIAQAQGITFEELVESIAFAASLDTEVSEAPVEVPALHA